MATEKPALIVKNKNASRNFKLNESFEAGICLLYTSDAADEP